MCIRAVDSRLCGNDGLKSVPFSLRGLSQNKLICWEGDIELRTRFYSRSLAASFSSS